MDITFYPHLDTKYKANVFIFLLTDNGKEQGTAEVCQWQIHSEIKLHHIFFK